MCTRTLTLIGLVATVFLACKSDDPDEPMINDISLGQAAMEQSAQASQAFTAVFGLVEFYALQHPQLTQESDQDRPPVSNPCGQVGLSATAGGGFPVVLTVEYPAACGDGPFGEVQGSFQATFNGPLYQRGTKVTIQLEDVVLNGVALSGDLRISDFGLNDAGQHSYRRDLIAGNYVLANGTRVVFDETVFAQQVQGASTSYQQDGPAALLDDVWEDNRTATLVTEDDNTFAVTTLSSLLRKADCAYATEGRLRMTSDLLTDEVELDYGQGDCDRNAMLYYGDEQIVVRL